MKKIYTKFLILYVILAITGSNGYSEDRSEQGIWKYSVMSFSELYSEAVNASKDASLKQKDLKAVLPDLLDYMGNQGWELCVYLPDGERYVFKKNLIVPAKSE